MQRITPFLWFHDQAEPAAQFYVSIFKHAKLGTVTRYGDGAPIPKGTVMTVSFELDGQKFVALNGGPQFTITPAISFVVNCESQAEVDHYWEKLVAGGTPIQCGWLTDRFGVSWQIVPTAFWKMMEDEDPRKSGRVMQALMQMVKLDVAALQKAYDG